MRKFLLLISLVTLLIPTLVFGAPVTIEGTIQGHNCVTQGRTCPIGMEDPLIATESIFVVLTPDNKYHFLPNIDRAVLARHIAEPVKIVGEMNSQHNSIRVQSLAVNKNGQWRVVWSQEMQKSFNESGLGPYPRQP